MRKLPVVLVVLRSGWVYKALRNLTLILLSILVIGNASIFVATLYFRAAGSPATTMLMPGVKNFEAVDALLWRGGAPSIEGYESLARNGVTTIVDLRAEGDFSADEQTALRLGIDLIRIPIRDGQVPSSTQVDSFLAAVRESSGTVFVNCGAGVGRTGAMAAAYLVESGDTSAAGALAINLAVGPPSLEQIAFVGSMGSGSFDPPPLIVTAVSRFLDAPRRLLHTLGL